MVMAKYGELSGAILIGICGKCVIFQFFSEQNEFYRLNFQLNRLNFPLKWAVCQSVVILILFSVGSRCGLI